MKKTTDHNLKKRLSFDTYGRYCVIRDVINKNRKGQKKFSVLEIGAITDNLSKFLTADSVSYLNTEPQPLLKNFTRGDGCSMPFPDSGFDWVISSDVFEHIPGSKRNQFLNENLRVAKYGVILTGPFYSREVASAEKSANDTYKNLSGGSSHVWLGEHIKNGLPREKGLERSLKRKGLRFQKIGNNSILLWQVLISTSFLNDRNLEQPIKRKIEEFNLFYNTKFLPYDFGRSTYRKIYFIKKGHRLKNLAIRKKEIAPALYSQVIGEAFAILDDVEKWNKQIISEREDRIANLDRTISGKETEIRRINQELTLMNSALSEQEKTIQERDIAIALKKNEIDQREEIITEKNKYILQKEEEISQARVIISSKDEYIGKKAGECEELKNIVANKGKELDTLKGQVRDIYSSNSWKITKPLRTFAELMLPRKRRRGILGVAHLILSQLLEPPEALHKLRRMAMLVRREGVRVFTAKFGDRLDNSGKLLSAAVSGDRPFGHIDVVELNGRFLFIQGWALSKKKVSKIEVYLDGILTGTASYGLRRSDVGFLYPQIKNSLHSGFVVENPLSIVHINTEEKHNVMVRLLDGAGRSSELNKQVFSKSKYNNLTKSWMNNVLNHFRYRPSLTIIIYAEKLSHELLMHSLENLSVQPYDKWDIFVIRRKPLEDIRGNEYVTKIGQKRIIYTDISGLKENIAKSSSDFCLFLDAQETLSNDALFEMAKYFNMHPDATADLVYFDEAEFYKPEWSPEYLDRYNYIGGTFLVRRTLLEREDYLSGLSAEDIHEAILRLSKISRNIRHIQRPLVIKSNREKLMVRKSGSIKEGQPKVSIIILTACKNQEENLNSCLSSLARKGTYQNLEVIIIDNSHGKLKVDEARSILSPRFGLKVIPYHGDFNFSSMNNLAVSSSDGEYLVFLNDDTQIISNDWIERMLDFGMRENVGAVGALLLYRDDTVQHAGLFLVDNGGGARHLLRHASMDEAKYAHLLNSPRECSAVTFACVLVPRKVYLELGGLDEILSVEGNDVDFCLRAMKNGYKVIWTPLAKLYHKESGSERPMHVSENTNFFWKRWRGLLEGGDPYFNPNLNQEADQIFINTRPVLSEHFAPVLPKVTNIRHSFLRGFDQTKVKNILLLKLDHIGDLILSIPAITMVRDKFPAARITLLSAEFTRPIAERIPGLDEVLTFDIFFDESQRGEKAISNRDMRRLESLLKDRKFGLAIDLRRNGETRKVLEISGARFTAGYETGFPADNRISLCLELTDDKKDTARQPAKPHIATQLCEIVRAIPVSGSGHVPSAGISGLRFSHEENERILYKFGSLFSDGLNIGIHAGTGNAMRRWPPEYFARLIGMITETIEAKIILFGSSKEKQQADEIVSLSLAGKERIVSLAGEVSLAEFPALAKRCDLFIGNVSGPAHIAGFLEIPTLMIFAGQVSPYEWSPLGEKTLTVRCAVPCSPCYKIKAGDCPYDLKCIRLLWPAKVFSAFKELMAISGIKFNPPEKVCWRPQSESCLSVK